MEFLILRFLFIIMLIYFTLQSLKMHYKWKESKTEKGVLQIKNGMRVCIIRQCCSLQLLLHFTYNFTIFKYVVAVVAAVTVTVTGASQPGQSEDLVMWYLSWTRIWTGLHVIVTWPITWPVTWYAGCIYRWNPFNINILDSVCTKLLFMPEIE